MKMETKSRSIELRVKAFGFPDYFGRFLSEQCRALPDVARHTKLASKQNLQKRSSPSLRSGAMASEVGAAGFEPTTSTSRTWRATGLRYAPNYSTNKNNDSIELELKQS